MCWPSCVTKHHGNTDWGLPVFYKCFKLCLPILCWQCISHIVDSLFWGIYSFSLIQIYITVKPLSEILEFPHFQDQLWFCVTGSENSNFYRQNRHSRWTRAVRELKDAWSSSLNVVLFSHMGLKNDNKYWIKLQKNEHRSGAVNFYISTWNLTSCTRWWRHHVTRNRWYPHFYSGKHAENSANCTFLVSC